MFLSYLRTRALSSISSDSTKVIADAMIIEIITTIAILFSTCLIYLLFNKWKIESRLIKCAIPFGKHWPIFGNMGRVLFRQTHLPDAIKEVYEMSPEAKYVVFFDFARPVIMLRDPELIKDITVRNAEMFLNHRGIVDEKVDPIFGNHLFSLKDQKWRHMRNLVTPSFTANKMKIMFGLMVECAQHFSNCVLEMTLGGREEFDVDELFSRYGSDVISSCAFGVQTNAVRDPENEFYKLALKSCRFQGLLSFKFFLLRSLPWISSLFRIKLFDEHLTKFFKGIIWETMKTRDEKGISRPDLLQLMMETRGSPNELDVTEMTSLAFMFFFGGFETTISQLSLLAQEIAQDLEMQKKLQDEIDLFTEADGSVTYEAVSEMTYLDALMKECLRMYAPSPRLERVCEGEYVLPAALPQGKPYILKPGDVVWIPTTPILRDPKYFSDPDKFVPDRFLGNKIPMNQHPFFPFGLGPRICIAVRFSMMQMKMAIIYLLLKCNLRVGSKTQVPMEFAKGGISWKSKGGFWLKIEPRGS